MTGKQFACLAVACSLLACGLRASIEWDEGPGLYECISGPNHYYVRTEHPETRAFSGLGAPSWIEFRDDVSSELVRISADQILKCTRIGD